MDLKKIDTDTLMDIALNMTSDNPGLVDACYKELMRRRKIQEKKRDMIPFIKAREEKLAKIAKVNAMQNPKVAIACYDEIIWRRNIIKIKELIEMEKDLGLDDNIKDFKGGVIKMIPDEILEPFDRWNGYSLLVRCTWIWKDHVCTRALEAIQGEGCVFFNEDHQKYAL
jgi:hypothetical protein